jgi:hypothetical protein
MLASLSLWPDSRKTPRSMGPDTKIAVNPEQRQQGPDHKNCKSQEKNRRRFKRCFVKKNWSCGDLWEGEGRPTSATLTQAPSGANLRDKNGKSGGLMSAQSRLVGRLPGSFMIPKTNMIKNVTMTSHWRSCRIDCLARLWSSTLSQFDPDIS